MKEYKAVGHFECWQALLTIEIYVDSRCLPTHVAHPWTTAYVPESRSSKDARQDTNLFNVVIPIDVA